MDDAASEAGPDGRPPNQDRYEQQALDFERALEDLAVAAVLAHLAGIIAAAGLHLKLGDVRRWLVKQIRAAPVNASGPVRAGIGEGVRLGATQAAVDADLGRLPAGLTVDDPTAAAVAGLDETIRAGLDHAAHLAQHAALAGDTDVTTVVAPALAAAHRVAATTRWAANRAVNVGTAAIAEHVGGELVWAAERDACFTCLALSGQVASAGGEFDASLTFADKPMPLFPIGDPQPLDHPPRHPGCRCRTRLWLPGSDPRFLTALKREAQRTVARGWSAYASEPAKLSAADRLLRHPTLLAASVRARARQAVATGHFST